MMDVVTIGISIIATIVRGIIVTMAMETSMVAETDIIMVAAWATIVVTQAYSQHLSLVWATRTVSLTEAVW